MPLFMIYSAEPDVFKRILDALNGPRSVELEALVKGDALKEFLNMMS